MNLIDRDNAVRALNFKAKQAYNKDNRLVYMIYKEAAELVDKLPTIENFPDIPPVKYGKWEDVGNKEFKCSECGIVLGGAYCYVYCPHCGAKML